LKILDVEIRYLGTDGKPLSAREFLDTLIDNLPALFKDEKQLRELWSNPDTREELLQKLERAGFDQEQLQMLREMFQAQDSDIFDVLAHLSFSKPIKARKQRAVEAKGDTTFFEVYRDFKAKDFLHFILDRYEKDGIEELRRDRLGELIKLKKMGTTKEAAAAFGGPEKLVDAFYGLQKTLYKAS